MRDNNYSFELFLEGRLEGGALQKFKDKLAADPGFAKEFELYRKTGEMLNRMHAYIECIPEISNPPGAPTPQELHSLEEEVHACLEKRIDSAETEKLRTSLKIVYEQFKKSQRLRIKRSLILGIAASLAASLLFSVILTRSPFQYKDALNENRIVTSDSTFKADKPALRTCSALNGYCSDGSCCLKN